MAAVLPVVAVVKVLTRRLSVAEEILRKDMKMAERRQLWQNRRVKEPVRNCGEM